MMGVYIKDIKMPTENNELRLIIHSNGQVFISHQTYFDETEAIPVPPHGRLIDADLFVRQLSDGSVSDAIVSGIEYRMSKMPTVIPASDKDTNVLGKEEGET